MSELIVASEGMGSWCKDFFIHMAKFSFDNVIFENSSRSQIILRSMFFNIESIFPALLPYVTWSGEPFETPERRYSPIFSIWKPAVDGSIPFLIVAFFELQRMMNFRFNLDDLRLTKNTSRPYFLAYCASAAYAHREEMFNILKSLDKTGTCHALGNCQNNVGFKLTGTWHNAWSAYVNYRFAFAMENRKIKYYVTEKLLNVLLSGAIPIYYGDSEWVKKVFNPKCIIFTDDFSSLEECAKYIVHVDTTPELFEEYQNQARSVIEKEWFTGENPIYREMSKLIKKHVENQLEHQTRHQSNF